MSDILLSPPVAFLLYLLLVGILTRAGSTLAGPGHPSALKTSAYASGEAPPARAASPGYRPYFTIALFFAVVHLGVLVIASAGPSPVAAVYVAGLMLILWVLALK